MMVRLRACDLDVCEARCCYDGVYLQDGEEALLQQIAASAPEAFGADFPAECIVDGVWDEGRVRGRKTAVRPYDYQSPSFPAHFQRTRCVFCRPDHKCSLQVLAVERKQHKWAFKPQSCWMFPLDLAGDRLIPPPTVEEADPQDLGASYPGFVTYTPCGRDQQADGEPWRDVLAEEIAYWGE